MHPQEFPRSAPSFARLGWQRPRSLEHHVGMYNVNRAMLYAVPDLMSGYKKAMKVMMRDPEYKSDPNDPDANCDRIWMEEEGYTNLRVALCSILKRIDACRHLQKARFLHTRSLPNSTKTRSSALTCSERGHQSWRTGRASTMRPLMTSKCCLTQGSLRLTNHVRCRHCRCTKCSSDTLQTPPV